MYLIYQKSHRLNDEMKRDLFFKWDISHFSTYHVFSLRYSKTWLRCITLSCAWGASNTDVMIVVDKRIILVSGLCGSMSITNTTYYKSKYTLVQMWILKRVQNSSATLHLIALEAMANSECRNTHNNGDGACKSTTCAREAIFWARHALSRHNCARATTLDERNVTPTSIVPFSSGLKGFLLARWTHWKLRRQSG